MTAPSHTSRQMPARPPGTGRRAWWVLAGTLRFVGRVLRGLIAAVALLALVAGLPWALWHYIGWPLPHHVPSWNEVRALLLAPMTPTFLLDVLAVACWIAWAAFLLDVARCTVDAVRGARWPEKSTAAAGPLRTLAAVLIGAIVLSLLGQRTTAANAAASAGWSDAVSGHTPVVATAVWHQPPSERRPGFTITPTEPTAATPTVAPSATAFTAVVRAPENGVHDSLWRLARDTLGNPDRWPEIFALNEGAQQPGGHRLTVPSLIYPGEELRLPPGAHPYAPGSLTSRAQPAAMASSPPGASTNPPTSTPPVTSAPPVPTTTTPPATPSTTQPAPSTGGATPGTAHRAPTATPPTTAPAGPSAPAPGPSSGQHSGLQLGTDIFLGLGLAAAASAALMLARHRYRSGYQPGSGRRDDLPVAPVVYRLRLAHLRATRDDDPDDTDDEAGGERVGPPGPTTPLVITNRYQAVDDPVDDPGSVVPRVGVRDGRDVALDLACTRGLGLLGAGAPAAARALLLALLSPPPAPRMSGSASAPAWGATVFVPAADLAGLLGSPRAAADLPYAVRVVADLDAALDEIEAEILRRTREHHDRTDDGTDDGTSDDTVAGDAGWPPIAIVATPPGYAPQRLQAVLDNGSSVGVTGVLLGQWQPGVTAYVTAEGRVSATNPGLGEPLRGARVFRLPEPDAADLLALLRLAQPEPRDPVADGGLARQHRDDRPPTVSATHSRLRDGADPAISDGAAARAAADHGDRDGVLEVAALAQGGLEITGPPPVPGVSGLVRPQRLGSAPRAAARDSTGNADGQRVNGAAAGITERADDATDPAPTATRESLPAAERTPGPAGDHASGTVRETADETAAMVPVALTVLGPVRVHWRPDTSTDRAGAGREITAALGPRQRELLAFLAVHRDGVTRDALVAALWPDGRPDRPTNALNAILGRLRRALASATEQAVSEILLAGDGRYQLDPAMVEVDLWHFHDAVAAQRATTTDTDRIPAYRRVVAAYGGKLAEGTEAEWLEAEADATRRDAIDAVAALARAMVEHDPAQTLELLETARTRDPYNELLYRDIMRLQDRLGRHEAIGRTLTQLTKRLAEINDKPSRQAVELATQLQARHATLPVSSAPRGGSPGPAATRGPRGEHHQAGPAARPTAGTRRGSATGR